MQNVPRVISLFLMDGSHEGRISCELLNWTGKGYKIPKLLLKETNRPDLQKAGVYCLFGKKGKASEINLVYIGEGENVYERLKQHLTEDYWHELVVFVSSDSNVNKAHVKFLEYTIWEVATEAGRYHIKNTNTPNRPALSEPDEAVMSEFFENLKTLMGTLGYRLFDPAETARREPADRYFLRGARGADAQAKVTDDDSVVVQQGSRAAGRDVPSTPASVIKNRDILVEDGILVRDGESFVFQSDYTFSSASAAASLVLGRSANGLTEWIDAEGRILKESFVSP